MTFTYTEKLECVQRELKLRRQVYPNRILTKRMSQEQADRQIALMEAIVADYEKAVATRERTGSTAQRLEETRGKLKPEPYRDMTLETAQNLLRMGSTDHDRRRLWRTVDVLTGAD